ncbi:MAG: TIGR00730 family Rossman fold protein [Flavobacteriaceae bacterium]
MKRLAVFCGASKGHSKVYTEEAQKLGKIMAQNEIELIYGGGKIGIMGVIADEILAHQGRVIGVIPHLLKHEEVEHPGISEMIYTETMSERKVIMSQKCDGYIALAGGFGTLDEIFEALTMGQLGIEQKPVGFLNTRGFYDGLMSQLDHMVHEGFLKPINRDMIILEEDLDVLMEKMNSYKAPKVTKVINTTVRDGKH